MPDSVLNILFRAEDTLLCALSYLLFVYVEKRAVERNKSGAKEPCLGSILG